MDAVRVRCTSRRGGGQIGHRSIQCDVKLVKCVLVGQARCHVGGGEAGRRGGAMWASRRQIGVTDQARVHTGVVGWARRYVGVEV